MDFFERFIAHLETRFPATASALDLRERLAPALFCPDEVPLPLRLKKEAEDIVRAFWSLRQLPERARLLEARDPRVVNPGNSSILMSYDFHIDSQGHLRLIEVNTNASMGLLVDALHDFRRKPNPFSADFKKDILGCIRQEHALAFPGGKELRRAAIIDDKPEQQRMYPEFLMYQELMAAEGITAQIADSQDLRYENGAINFEGELIDFVYNRDTDFYLEAPTRAHLRAAMLAKATCFSPHPHEYRLLADKDRLLELSKPGALDNLPLSDDAKAIIDRTLIHTVEVSDFPDQDALWKERKKWFFKPSRSFGGKAAYRGSAVGRTVFAKIISSPYLAQEYVPASNIRLASMPDESDFKFDLRFFAYQDRIQIACARVYKGQMTNSQTAGGGVTIINWE